MVVSGKDWDSCCSSGRASGYYGSALAGLVDFFPDLGVVVCFTGEGGVCFIGVITG